MWVFLNNAFVSIVANRDVHKKLGANTLLVRSRTKGDIERAFPDKKRRTTVVTGKGTDYKFRAVVDRAYAAEQLAAAVLSIGYDNFKGSIPMTSAAGRKRHDAYMRVWTVMRQEQEPGGLRPLGGYYYGAGEELPSDAGDKWPPWRGELDDFDRRMQPSSWRLPGFDDEDLNQDSGRDYLLPY